MCAVGHSAGKQGGASRGAEGINMEVSEPYTLAIKGIKVRCLYGVVAVAGKVAIALIIGYDQNNIWLFDRGALAA